MMMLMLMLFLNMHQIMDDASASSSSRARKAGDAKKEAPSDEAADAMEVENAEEKAENNSLKQTSAPERLASIDR